MTVTQRYSIGFGVAVLLACISWLTISPGTPKVYAPLNLVVMLPAFFSEPLLGAGYVIAATMFVPLIFCLWCVPLLRGRDTLPTRSIVLFVIALVLSAVSLAFGFSYRVQYQSNDYAVGVIILNIVCWGVVCRLAVSARRRPSYARNLAFHGALFAWLAWCAIPWSGELP